MNEDFFRRCWLILKATNPRMRKRMTEIECGIEGIKIREQTVLPAKESKKKDADEKDKLVPI